MASKLVVQQVVALHVLMASHCAKGDDGFAVYEKGWDDDRILKEFENPTPDRPVTRVAVAGMRLKMFGRIRTPSVGADAERIAKLEEQIAHLTEVVNGLSRRISYSHPPGRPQATPHLNGKS